MNTDSKYYQYNPEKVNIFIETHFQRSNSALNIFTGFFSLFFSHSSSIVEVFLRKKFGERYITLSQSILLFILMNTIFILDWAETFIELISRKNIDGFSEKQCWFVFLFSCIYLGFSIKHRLEIKKYGTAYDLKRFSLSDGEEASFWSKITDKKIFGVRITPYLVSIIFEPAIPIIIGIILSLFHTSQAVGILLIFCGFTFGVNKFSKAQTGRNWVLDNIDKKITNEMKYDVFIERKPKQDTKGVYLPINLPLDDKTRQELYNMVEDSFSSTNDIWASDELDDKPVGSEGARGGRTGGSEGGGGRSTEEGRQRDGKTETGGGVGNGKTETQNWSNDGHETGNG